MPLPSASWLASWIVPVKKPHRDPNKPPDKALLTPEYSEALDDKRFARDMFIIEVSSDGSTWQPVRTYNRPELVYRMVETSPWHAGSTTLAGMDGKWDVHIRFRALDGIGAHEFLLDVIEVIADDARDNGNEVPKLRRR